MTEETYNKYTILKEELDVLLELNKNLEVKDIRNVPIIEIGWLELTFGSGSSRISICKDKDLIFEIKNIILDYHNKKIEEIEKEMREL